MSANSINDIELDHFGSGIDYLATTSLGPCIGFVVLLDNNQHIFIEHRSPAYLPPSINLATVRLCFQNVAKQVSDLLPTSSITNSSDDILSVQNKDLFDLNGIFDINEILIIIKTYCQKRHLVLDVIKTEDSIKMSILERRMDTSRSKYFASTIILVNSDSAESNKEIADLDALFGSIYSTRGIKRNHQLVPSRGVGLA
ncbi:unnamed protein product [Rotaria magnacalcarata]